MAESNSFTHLPLPLLFQGKPKLHGGGGSDEQTKYNVVNRTGHGDYIKRRLLNCRVFGKSAE